MMASTQQGYPLNLEKLDALLRREDMAHSPDIWINIHRLLLPRIAAGVLPDEAKALAHLLGPLVCKTPQHQQRLDSVIKEWLGGQPPVEQAQLHAPQQPAVTAWQKRISHFNRRSLLGLVLLLIVLAGFAWATTYWPQPPEVKLPPLIPEQTDTKPTPNLTKHTIPITDWVAPNPFPAPIIIPANWLLQMEKLGWMMPGLPIPAALIWLMWRYRRQTVLTNKPPQGEQLLIRLNLDMDDLRLLTPFRGPEMKSADKLRYSPAGIDSRHLDVEASVIAAANQAGFFTPRYRQQHNIRPEYLVLVQSIHGNDQSAVFAELLVAALEKNNMAIRSYRFRDDPRRLIPWIQPPDSADKAALSLAQLALRRGAARLIVISDWDIVYQPYRHNQLHDWVKDFNSWQPEQRIWLCPGFEQQESAEKASQQAKDLKFRLLPLASPHIGKLADWLTQEGGGKSLSEQTHDEFVDFLPEIFTETSDSWLDWHPPYGIDLKRLDKELLEYLTADGFLLLQTLAVFPKPLWPLPHVLDIQLFAEQANSTPTRRWPWQRLQQRPENSQTDTDETLRKARELRLLRLSRLPWLRQTFMPDYLRLRLLKQLNRPQRRRIRSAWASLLNALISGNQQKQISLPIAEPNINKKRLRDRLTALPNSDALNDAIFANIIMGGKLGLLDFRLSNALAKLLPGISRQLDLRPAITALVLTLLSVPGLHYLWETQGKPALTSLWQERIDRQNADWQVNLNYQPTTQPLADALVKALQTDNFNASQGLALNQPAFKDNQINYPVGAVDIANQVAQHLRWLTYGAAVTVTEAPALPAKTLLIQLGKTYQHTAGFNDTLHNLYQATFEIKEIPAKISGQALEPALVIVPADSFLMGSPDSEPIYDPDESPQHPVTIAQSFAIGKYEVTFAEYDRYAKSANLKLPDDQVWGRDQRPVINVSFNEAQAYVAWLSKQSGLAYRLPSEAEWEYAARAGSNTAYWWGDSIGKNHAVCNGCGSQWDGKQTAPVGSLKANKFGLYDTAGNVWEWTQDCWHNNYDQAPTDGSAWLDANGGECDRRVVRGGSWYYFPQGLRSANRNRIGDAAYGTGFRVARAL
jgi:formylglycine-generating enzyme required for sulfatase activity